MRHRQVGLKATVTVSTTRLNISTQLALPPLPLTSRVVRKDLGDQIQHNLLG